MRKKYIYLVLLLVFNTVMFAQKVILTPTAVNGASVSSSGPINLGGTPNSSVSLGVRVEMPVIPGNTGTISIYSIYGLNANVVIGGNGGILIFNEGKVASRSFVVNLSWSDFQTSGGYIYAEYKTASGVAYKSGYISVIKNATMGGGTVNPPADAPNPSKIPNTLCCNQTVRLGDKPAPINGSQYLNPYENYIHGINSSWAAQGNASVRFNNIDKINKTLDIDYIAEPGNFTVTRKLGYNGNNDFPNKSNTVNITVVPNPILTNVISTNEPLNSEGFIELSNLKGLEIFGYNSTVNLGILENPFYVVKPRDPGTYVDAYKWEYTRTNSALAGNLMWIAIPDQNFTNLVFHDPSTNLEDTYYLIRRIAIYKNISKVSNTIKVIVRGLRLNNTICCDQILKIQSSTNFENPQIINGSTVNLDNPIEGNNFNIQSITYQWQSKSMEENRTVSAWSNIIGATSKDYIPSQPLTLVLDRRGSYNFKLSYQYRRIATINYSYITNKVIYETSSSCSNESSLEGTTSQAYIQLYPNPTSSILNIESTVDISDAKITISNIMGNVVNSNNYSVLNPKLISINVANFPAGTYFIIIENQHLGAIQRTFIKQ